MLPAVQPMATVPQPAMARALLVGLTSVHHRLVEPRPPAVRDRPQAVP